METEMEYDDYGNKHIPVEVVQCELKDKDNTGLGHISIDIRELVKKLLPANKVVEDWWLYRTNDDTKHNYNVSIEFSIREKDGRDVPR